MSLANTAAQLLKEAGVTPDDILNAAGVDRQGAVRKLASELGVDLNDLATQEGQPVEISDADVAKVRDGLAVLNRAFA